MIDPEDLATLRERYPRGLRVQFLEFGSPDPSPLAPGDAGTVTRVDDLGTVHVAWDSGLRLGLVVHSVSGEPVDRIAPLTDVG